MDKIFSQFWGEFMDPDRLPVALAAVLIAIIIGVVTGPLGGNSNPFLWLLVDGIFGNLGDKLNKTHRAKADLVFRGFLVTAGGVFAALGLGKLMEKAIQAYNIYGLAEPLILALLLTGGTVWLALLKLYFAV